MTDLQKVVAAWGTINVIAITIMGYELLALIQLILLIMFSAKVYFDYNIPSD